MKTVLRLKFWALLLACFLSGGCCSSLFTSLTTKKRDLVAAVTVDLDDARWTRALDARAAAAGLASVLCALDRVLADLSTSTSAATSSAALNLGELHGIALAERRRARAEAWQAVHR